MRKTMIDTCRDGTLLGPVLKERPHILKYVICLLYVQHIQYCVEALFWLFLHHSFNIQPPLK